MAESLGRGQALSQDPWQERWRNLTDRLLRELDRLTYRKQKIRTRTRLGQAPRPARILVVCTGNICRSPYAAALLRMELEKAGIREIGVDSAGFLGPGRPAEPRGVRIAGERGVDLGAHCSRLVEAEDPSKFDLFLVMTRRHRDDLARRFAVSPDRIVLLADFDPSGGPEREIADPYGQPDAAFEKAFDQIERSVNGLSEFLAATPR